MRHRLEVASAAAWDLCRPGRSPLDAAFVRNFDLEVAFRTEQLRGAILWDIENIRYRSCHHSVQHALEVDFPFYRFPLVLPGILVSGICKLLNVSRPVSPLRSVLPDCLYQSLLFNFRWPS